MLLSPRLFPLPDAGHVVEERDHTIVTDRVPIAFFWNDTDEVAPDITHPDLEQRRRVVRLEGI